MQKRQHFAHFILFAALVLITAASQIHYFDRLNFRQDEIATVYGGVAGSLQNIVWWMSRDIHPPLWHVLGAAWAGLFGSNEGIIRFSSVLVLALALAVTYRFCADLFGHRAAVIATAALGTLALFHFYSHEFRPYGMLAGLAAAAQWSLLRWVRRPDFKHALLFVVVGILNIYIHYFGLFVVGATAAAFIVLVRWNGRLYLRAFGLFAAVGLSYLGWIVPFAYLLMRQRGGINYGLSAEAMPRIIAALQVQPLPLSLYLLAVGLLLPLVLRSLSADPRMRGGRWWRQAYLLVYSVVAVLLILRIDANISVVTLRNLIILAPAMMLLVAAGIARHPRLLQPLLVGIIMYPSIFAFRNLESQLPLREVAAAIRPHYQPGSPIILHTGLGRYQHTVTSYNLLMHIPGVTIDNLIQLQSVASSNLPVRNVGPIIDETDAASVARFRELIDGHESVWFVQGTRPNDRREFYLAELEQRYAPLRYDRWDNFSQMSAAVTEYRRIPDDLRPLFIFDETFVLLKWLLRDSVEVAPCQTITFESWWESRRRSDFDLSLTLALADSAGVGVARADAQPGYEQTSDWVVGQPYPDARTLTIPCDAAPGEYPLLIGLYYPYIDNPQALPVTTAEGAPMPTNLIYLTTLFIQ